MAPPGPGSLRHQQHDRRRNARTAELFRWTWRDDIDFDGRQVRLGTRKTVDGSLVYEWIPMIDSLYEALKTHRQAHPYEHVFVQWLEPKGKRFEKMPKHKGRPFKQYRGFPQNLCDLAGVRPFGAYGIRHLSATIMADEGVAVPTIQKILRHAKLSTTEQYIHELVSGRKMAGLRVLEGRGKKIGPTGPNIGPNYEERASAAALTLVK
ncbi:MAG: tyrosine-type recombinase/integrase [Desulfovibrionales bacterium]